MIVRMLLAAGANVRKHSSSGSIARIDPGGALQQVLGAEHAAVYGYGLVGSRLTAAEEASATGAFAWSKSTCPSFRKPRP